MSPDGSPNLAVFIFGAVDHKGKLYIRLNLAQCQSRLNILVTKQAVAMYAKTPDVLKGDKPLAISGARMKLCLVEDEGLLNLLSGGKKSPSLFMEVVELRPLG